MRLGCGLCPEEQAFLSKRKQVVAAALKKALQLDQDLQDDEVWGLSSTGWFFPHPCLGPGLGGLCSPELVSAQACRWQVLPALFLFLDVIRMIHQALAAHRWESPHRPTRALPPD